MAATLDELLAACRLVIEEQQQHPLNPPSGHNSLEKLIHMKENLIIIEEFVQSRIAAEESRRGGVNAVNARSVSSNCINSPPIVPENDLVEGSGLPKNNTARASLPEVDFKAVIWQDELSNLTGELDSSDFLMPSSDQITACCATRKDSNNNGLSTSGKKMKFLPLPGHADRYDLSLESSHSFSKNLCRVINVCTKVTVYLPDWVMAISGDNLKESELHEDASKILSEELVDIRLTRELANLSAQDYARIVASLKMHIAQHRVAEILAKHICKDCCKHDLIRKMSPSRPMTFTCEHAALAVMCTSRPMAMALRLLPYCSDVDTNSSKVQKVLGNCDLTTIKSMASRMWP